MSVLIRKPTTLVSLVATAMLSLSIASPVWSDANNGISQSDISSLQSQVQQAADTMPAAQAKKPRRVAQAKDTGTAQKTTASKPLGSGLGLISALNKLPVYLDSSHGFAFDKFPHVGFGLAFMKAKSKFAGQRLLLGGFLEMDAQAFSSEAANKEGGAVDSQGTFTSQPGIAQSGSSMAATTVTIDTVLNLNDEASVFLAYGDGGGSTTMTMKKAFFAYGNLQKSPFYAIAGLDYLPFGLLSGGAPWSPSLTQNAIRPNETNALTFGYSKDNLDTSFALFNNTHDNKSMLDFSYSVSYEASLPTFHYQVGAGYLNDVRGLSSSLGQYYTTTAASSGKTRNSLFDINASVGHGIFNLLTELTRGSTKVGTNSGKPLAWDATFTAAPQVQGKPITFLLGYSATSGMEGVPMALTSYLSVYSVKSGLKSNVVASATRQMLVDNLYLSAELSSGKTYDGNSDNAVTLDAALYI